MTRLDRLRIAFWWEIEKRIPSSEADRWDRPAVFVYRHRKAAERRGGLLG